MAEDKAKDQETVETPADSQPEEQTPAEEVAEVEETPTPKAEAPEDWENLKGNTQDRIKQILRERDEWKEKASQTATNDAERVAPPQPSNDDAEVRAAIEKLKAHGVPTTEDVQELVKNQVARLETDRTHERLEQKYSGEGGAPKYVREEVEDYGRKKGIYNLEAAYRDMYWDELNDVARRRTSSSSRKPSSASSAKTTEEPVTLESIKKNLSGPNAMDYYNKHIAPNPKAFDELIRSLSK